MNIDATRPPNEPLLSLFTRFLRFGALAFGGPVAQIAMIKAELVERERWVSPERFNRALAVYQALPGPEAHELCVYFGMVARGRWGGLLAGLGFLLPGFVLMCVLSWVYVTYGTSAAWVQATFLAVQAAVAALIVRAVHRLGIHALANHRLWAIALAACAAQLSGVPFLVTLSLAGLGYALSARGLRVGAATVAAVALATVVLALWVRTWPEASGAVTMGSQQRPATWPALLWLGLKSGLLTFGGAYTAIPLVQKDAVLRGGWLSDAQFLDGLGLSGVLPAPFIIFTTFVGFVAGGWMGALLTTFGTFLPAFAFTLVAHQPLEQLMTLPAAHAFLDGIAAAVVGIISATTLLLLPRAVSSPFTGAVAVLALGGLYLGKGRYTTLSVISAAAGAGFLRWALQGP